MPIEPQALGALDFAYIFAETNQSPQVIVNAYLLDAVALPRTSLLELIAGRIDRSPVFTSRLARTPFDLAPMRWVPDDDFDLDRHVFVRDHGGTQDVALNEALAELAVAPMDLTRAPWDLYLLKGVSGDQGRVDALVVRVHHSACDGIESANIGRMLLSDIAPTSGTPGPASTYTDRSMTVWEAVTTVPIQLIEYWRSTRRLRLLRELLASRIERGEIVSPQARRPRTVFNGPVTTDRVVGTVTFTMDEVRAARSTGATVNDVMLATVSGALASHFGRDTGHIPALATLVPKSVRDLSEIDAANKVTPMIVDLHTTVSDPHQRLHAIRRSVHAERQRKECPEVLESMDCAAATPAFLVRLGTWLAARLPSRAPEYVELSNLCVSNYMREPTPLTLGGATVTEIRCVPLIHHGSGLAHMVASCGESLTLTFTVDRLMMPDSQAYEGLLRESFEGLLA